MNILGVDVETTSLDVDTCRIIELGLALYHVPSCQTLFQNGGLVKTAQPVSAEITEITGITQDMVSEFGLPWEWWEGELKFMLSKADAMVAHNVKFDRPVLLNHVESRTIRSRLEEVLWIDTMTDIPYPKSIATRKLEYLCFEHKFLNPFPHRALTDVLSMLVILSEYNFGEVLERAKAPNIWVRADVSFDDKQKAKDRRYWWDGVNRWWVKQLKDVELDAEEAEANFPIATLPNYEFKVPYTG